MNTPTTTRKSHLPTPGRVSLNNGDQPSATPRNVRKSMMSQLPAPLSSTAHSTSKILQSSIANSPNKLNTNTPIRKQSKLQAPSPSLPKSERKCSAGGTIPESAPTALQLTSPLSVDDRTVKINNKQSGEITLQRSSLSGKSIGYTLNPKRSSSSGTVGKAAARKGTGSVLKNNYRNSKMLSLSLSASSSTETDIEEAVKVCVRIRPLPDCHSEQRAWSTGSIEQTIVRTGPDNNDNHSYRFDNVFGEEATTDQVYDTMVQDIVSSVCRQGRNGTVFTYGQTSTGKTYTMHGIISSAARDIFNFSEEDRSDRDRKYLLTCVKVSCMELYNEDLRDLLDRGIAGGDSSSGLAIKEDRRGNVQIPNLTERVVKSVEELLAVLSEADNNRTVGSTAMNERSSRSHTIFRITYEKKEARDICGKRVQSRSVVSSENDTGVECTLEGLMEDDSGDKENGGLRVKKTSKKMVTTVSTLNLVDLAGSESVRHTGATGDRQKEGGKINQSLLTLSTVLVKLGKREPGHINYRDSKLTRILKPSLAGNARMAAICCITPLMQFQEESKSTLDFASRTMLVTTNASRNETVEYDDALVGNFEKEIERLKTETANAEKGQQKLALSLQESTEQIVCLMASIEIEKSKVSNLEKQNYEFMMQVEELTLLNEELKAVEKTKSIYTDTALLKSLEDLKAQNENLQKKIHQLVEEKSHLEFRLMREVNKAEKRKDAALEKRKRFKNKLGDMKARLREDIAGTVSHPIVVD
ncbi:hypothetical protein HJC23_001322 [Cyclotella cryptica]|uniref:Kinesin-like protein n=1 Tax=Cyclotella cryptica TaxID=29204 RepID=A0ABD3NWR0_9STRA|eukprot:CCRYP_019259-RA/>CCRYP_019259-RA protein AED:0.03 eAED:0.03 QI:289/1/1/1/1/1/3/175/754